MTDFETQQRRAVVAEALSWVNTPYHHEGRVKGQGVDCAMLVADVFNRCGLVPFVDPRPYSAQFHLNSSDQKYLSWLAQYGRAVPAPPLPGDLVCFKIGRCVSHVGIVISWPQIVHSYASAGICLLEDVSCVNFLWYRVDSFLRLNGWED